MDNRFISRFLLVTLFAFIASGLHAQDFNEEMRRQLRESVRPDIRPDIRQQHHQSTAPIRPLRHQQEAEQEVLQVSPTGRVPQRTDRLHSLYSIEMFQTNLNLNFLNENHPQATNYSNFRVHPLSNAHCIIHRSQAQGANAGGGGVTLFSGDLDPVRAIQNIRERRRQERLDEIFRELDLWFARVQDSAE
jgi:hypothetical protein